MCPDATQAASKLSAFCVLFRCRKHATHEGARTRQKHKRKRVEPAADAVDARHEAQVAVLQAAETAAEAAFAQVQRENQPVAASVREWLQEAYDDVNKYWGAPRTWKPCRVCNFSSTGGAGTKITC